MDLIRADLKQLNIEMDVFYSEKSLYGTGRIEAVKVSEGSLQVIALAVARYGGRSLHLMKVSTRGRLCQPSPSVPTPAFQQDVVS